MAGGELFTHLYQRENFTENEVRIYIGEIILALERLHKVRERETFKFQKYPPNFLDLPSYTIISIMLGINSKVRHLMATARLVRPTDPVEPRLMVLSSSTEISRSSF